MLADAVTRVPLRALAPAFVCLVPISQSTHVAGAEVPRRDEKETRTRLTVAARTRKAFVRRGGEP